MFEIEREGFRCSAECYEISEVGESYLEFVVVAD
jgi:hypothetical protein